MNRSLTIAAAALLLSAPAAAAQLDAPSTTRGFFVGANLLGATFDTDEDDDFEAFTGGGLGIELGYGFSSGLALFVAAEGGGMENEDEDLDAAIDDRVQVDLGARVSFGGGRRALVPFLEAAMSGIVLSSESETGDEVMYSGAGVTIGGGVQYFVRRTLSLNAGVRLTNGALTTVEIDGDEEEDVEDQFFAASRLLLGVTWHP